VLDNVVVAEQAVEPLPVVEPFKPSVMFVAEQPVVKKKAGRPKSTPQSI
jgi:hypothetical protein